MAQKISVLVVDDELGPRESMRMILNPAYEVHTAADGQEALEFIRNHKVDLVTLDLKMPGLSGIDVVREIKRDNNDVEVIIITAYGTLQNFQDVRRYGVNEFVCKPFNVSDLIQTIDKSLRRRSEGTLKTLSHYNSIVVRK